jgi:hypothetical protein
MANTLKDYINKINASHTSAADSDNPVCTHPFFLLLIFLKKSNNDSLIHFLLLQRGHA